MAPNTSVETDALDDHDTQTLRLPDGTKAEVTATWRTWLAYEELQAFYDFSADEVLELVVEQCGRPGYDPSLAFELVVAHCYAGCRHDEEELPGGDR
ncbi:MAG: hypothetical protein AAF368_09125 [Planctomycetota bacterium]